MNCMKCGRETQSEAIFCPECLEDMRRHPVKVDTRVNITPRNVKKRPDSPGEEPRLNQAETIRSLKRSNRFLMALLLCCVILLGGVVGLFGWYVANNSAPSIGQNYSTVTESTAP